MGKLKVDTAEVRELRKVLARAEDVAPVEARKVVARGALNIKTDAARRVSGLAHAPAYPRSITYDLRTTLTGAWAEIGPDKSRRQGALGNVIEYGTVNNPPRPHIGPAADAERPRFERALEDLAVKALNLR